MGLNSNDRKKNKEKGAGDLPPSGRSWPFKRSKGKNKNVEVSSEDAAASGATTEDEQPEVEPEEKPQHDRGHGSTSDLVVAEEFSEAERIRAGSNSEVIFSDEDIAAFSPVTDRERLLYQDIQNVRAKCVQMEKTMRWWSDCTANWREKWGRVRAERNKLREETKIIIGRNEALTRELTSTKQEIEDHILENQSVRNELTKCKMELKKLDKEKRTAVVEPHLVQSEGITNGKIELIVPNIGSVYDSTIPKSGSELQFLEQILSEGKGVLSQIHDGTKETKMTGPSAETKDLREYEKAFGQKTR